MPEIWAMRRADLPENRAILPPIGTAVPVAFVAGGWTG
jgi:hypothetical protein